MRAVVYLSITFMFLSCANNSDSNNVKEDIKVDFEADKAIEICQNNRAVLKKDGTMNLVELAKFGLYHESTNLDLANAHALNDETIDYKWISNKVGESTYIVGFVDTTDSGLFWEVNTSNKISKYINGNECLLDKYHMN